MGIGIHEKREDDSGTGDYCDKKIERWRHSLRSSSRAQMVWRKFRRSFESMLPCVVDRKRKSVSALYICPPISVVLSQVLFLFFLFSPPPFIFISFSLARSRVYALFLLHQHQSSRSLYLRECKPRWLLVALYVEC